MKIKTPVIMVNFKTYEEGTGDKAVKLAKVCEKYNAVCAVQAADISRVARAINTAVIAQHVDNIGFGKNTGSILPQSIRESGAVGTLINHSEKRLKIEVIEDIVKICKELELYSIVCAKKASEAEQIASLKPDFIAIELPKLIGGIISISKAEPELIKHDVEIVKKINKKISVLCGAGIHTREDVKRALELGADGVLVARGVVKARNPEEVLKHLVKGLG